MITNGFIVIDRKILDWRWWDDPLRVKAWIWMLIQANWKDVEWRKMTIKRGSFVTSYNSISNHIGCSKKTAMNIVNDFVETGEITKISKRRFTIITICNYDSYQAEREKQEPINAPIATPQSSTPIAPIATPQSSLELHPIEQYNNITNNTSSSLKGDKIKLTYIKTNQIAMYFASQTDLWRESTRNALHIGTDESKLNELIVRYQNEMISAGNEEKEEGDLRRHFLNWARKVLSSEKKRDRGQETGQKQGKKMADPSAYGIDQKVFTDKWEE